MVIKSESGSVDSNDISNSLNDGEIFESLGIQNDGGVVSAISGSLLVLNVEGGINNFEGADVLILVGLVWE